MTEQAVNIPLLRKAVEWAEAEAAKPSGMSQWYQGAWAANATAIRRDGSCGTCYCIAGFAVAQTDSLQETSNVWTVVLNGEVVDEDAFSEIAAGRLGLDRRQAQQLFSAGNTIGDIRRIAEGIAGEKL